MLAYDCAPLLAYYVYASVCTCGLILALDNTDLADLLQHARILVLSTISRCAMRLEMTWLTQNIGKAHENFYVQLRSLARDSSHDCECAYVS